MTMNYDQADAVSAEVFINANMRDASDLRQDASIFVAKQLDYVKSHVYTKKLPPMKGLSLVPVATDVPEYAETVTYKVYDEFGIAKIISNYADDLPRADVLGTEITVKVKDIGDSYGYNINELQASLATGMNLPERKATAARRAVEMKMNSIAMVGDPAYKLYGLLTHPNIGITAITGNWAAATDDVILADLDAIYDSIRVQSNGVHTPNVIALPVKQFSRITTVRVQDANGMTVAQFFLAKHPGLRFEEVPEFKGAGSGGSDVIMAFEQSEENFYLDIPRMFTQLAAQARNLELVVPCIARSAGVSVIYPLALTKAEGI